eukprot:10618673-Lingulodinium_polyedra.AAC.1
MGCDTHECHYDCTLPVALNQSDGDTTCIGNLTVSSVPDSDLPGLLGLASLRENRAVLDFRTLKLYFCGPD